MMENTAPERAGSRFSNERGVWRRANDPLSAASSRSASKFRRWGEALPKNGE